MKDKFKYIFYITLVIGTFLLGTQTCKNKEIKYISKVETTHDTIWPDTTKIEVPKSYMIHDTFKMIEYYEIPQDSIQLQVFFQKRAYERSYKDKNIEILVQDTIVGYLIGQKTSYKAFKPISIVNSTITTVKSPDTLKIAPKWEFKAGTDITVKNLYLNVELELNRNSYNIGYDPFNKQIRIGYKRTLFRSKKGYNY